VSELKPHADTVGAMGDTVGAMGDTVGAMGDGMEWDVHNSCLNY